MSHRNAPLTPAGRLRLAKCVVEDGWSLRTAAGRFSVSVSTARRWAGRYRELGAAGMADRSSRPHHSPRRSTTRLERRIVGLRVSRRWGPHRIAYRLGVPVSTVHAVIVRYRCPRLSWTDPATGTRVRTVAPRRYEHCAPGDLVHVDIKKLARIPDGGGHRSHGRRAGRKIKKQARPGYAFLHNAVDDHSRLAYSEILADETKETTAGFWLRAHAYFSSCGITVTRVLTDNGSAYRSQLFAETLGTTITHKRTRPYRPQTNGKVERFNRTLLEEWAYAKPYQSETERANTYQDWIHTYNHHRGHTALGGATPSDRVPNLSGKNN